MRIHRMRLEGLGPYAQAQDVDFDRLNAAGLFLLDGPTGAGKSTVLAALCFALYGTVPGGRSAESLVTTLREPGAVIPEVQVEFTVQGRRFEVVRSPKHERPRRRRSAAGGATVTTQATVSLRERVDGEWTAPLTRADEVGQQIAAVLHLDAEQFMQVVLLPQGQFAQFLTAKSDERRALLRRLFGTQRFDGVEEHLRVETARLDTAVAVDADVARTARAQLAEALHEALGPDWHAPEPSPDTDERLLTLAAERAGRAHEDARAALAYRPPAWADLRGIEGRLHPVELCRAVAAFLDGLRLFGLGYSWGGFESLITHETAQLATRGSPPKLAGELLRLHVGLEDPADLIADLEAGLATWRSAISPSGA